MIVVTRTEALGMGQRESGDEILGKRFAQMVCGIVVGDFVGKLRGLIDKAVLGTRLHEGFIMRIEGVGILSRRPLAFGKQQIEYDRSGLAKRQEVQQVGINRPWPGESA